MKRLFAVLSLLLVTSCIPRPISKMTPAQRSELLATERGRLPDLTNPVDRTRSYIKISEVLLTFAFKSFEGDEMEDMEALLGQYLTAVKGARDAIVNSDRDAGQNPEGYQDLETALKGQLRLLQDMNTQSLDYSRKPILDASEAVVAVRDEMARLLSR